MVISNIALLAAFVSLRYEIARDDAGICLNVRDFLTDLYEGQKNFLAMEAMLVMTTPQISELLYDHIFKHWPKVTDDKKYPIPGGALAYSCRNKWEKDSAYCDLRRELVEFSIKYLVENKTGEMQC